MCRRPVLARSLQTSRTEQKRTPVSSYLLERTSWGTTPSRGRASARHSCGRSLDTALTALTARIELSDVCDSRMPMGRETTGLAASPSDELQNCQGAQAATLVRLSQLVLNGSGPSVCRRATKGDELAPRLGHGRLPLCLSNGQPRGHDAGSLVEIVQTSSVVQHRRHGCSRRRNGSRRTPAARPAVDCSFAPGAVTSSARIASLHHAYWDHAEVLAASVWRESRGRRRCRGSIPRQTTASRRRPAWPCQRRRGHASAAPLGPGQLSGRWRCASDVWCRSAMRQAGPGAARSG